MRADHMNRLLKVFTMIMVITVVIGMVMELGTILSFPGMNFADMSSTVNAIFRSALPEGKSSGKPKQIPLLPEKDRKLNLSPEKAAQLRSAYEGSLNNPRIQFEAVEKIEQYLILEFPKTWKERKFEAFSIVFPKHKEQLYQLSGKVDTYNAWLDASWGILLGIKRAERNKILWTKRQEIFGNLAQDIWQNDVKDEAIYAVLDGLNKVRKASLEDKVNFFVGSIRQAYEGEADAFMKTRRQALLDGFMGLESIQADLNAMQPEQRRQSLMYIRKSLGMEESELRQWDSLEKTRDERWEKGFAYMKEREKAVRSLQDEAREQALSGLREKYFGPDAEIIMHEEEAGFFRFNVKRVYGKN
jgi:hypothetical protein